MNHTGVRGENWFQGKEVVVEANPHCVGVREIKEARNWLGKNRELLCLATNGRIHYPRAGAAGGRGNRAQQ